MAYDEALAARIRDLLAGEEVTEKKMFGGLAFLVDGNMSVAASGQDAGLLVRIDPSECATLSGEPGVEPMEMRGREMKGWLRVSPDVLDDETLGAWVTRGLTYARTLPPK